ncbi:twin-arginine translocation signal domain-containing protein [Paenibacillus sp. 7541]|uniref:Acg family FMN-binding oxidoreductase n=1 Tax=Paenibacillus sp. 7541 TaxID=2026236 RepID=UPI000BA54F8C|nr:twin-arginine translocation signal domain-containing protein [Paenibacillus sp. 7541]PAK51655.1 hypothetical protein CHH75_13860 [Paenibacillus sp. 7541]
MEPTKSDQPHKNMSRRNFLKASGAALVLLAGGGLYRAVDQGVFSTARGPAYVPWNVDVAFEPDLAEKDPVKLVQYAILAANAHNTQPWLFRVQDNRIELFADLSRNIGAMDPFYREMNISLGCAIENLCLAAKAFGYEPKVQLHEGEFDRIKVADITLSDRIPEVSPLFRMMTKRHTHRGAYDTKQPIPEQLLRDMSLLSRDNPNADLVWHADDQSKKHVGALIIQATEAIIQDSVQAHDSHRWYRHTREDIHRFKDGTTLDATGNPAFVRALGKLLPISEASSNDYWLSMTKDTHIPTAAAFGSIVVSARSRTQLLEAGRLWQRVHLWATSKGLALHPLNQANERQDREQQLGLEPLFGSALQRLAGRGEHVFLFRIVYAREQAIPSPRRAAEEVQLQ